MDNFYKILSLGHLIEIGKPRVWSQRVKLRRALKHLVDDSKPLESKLKEILEPRGRHHIAGAGLNFMSKILAVHDSQRFTVFNAPVAEALKSFAYEAPRGYSIAQKYLAFAELMRRFLNESGARSTLDLDAFFFEYWEQHIKPHKPRNHS